ncbi:putative effector protein [Ceratobasidium theobromae]|uniref:Putative effector protein n=1 Tax=Ceratobasidium theobromae TaxID=1582974 RepID=A0A5N5QD76_9AGAM|nr:putative effector protein [Ceratobasidium theobromae]
MLVSSLAAVIASAMALVSASPMKKWHGCDVSGAELDLPSTNVISVPKGTKPEYIVLGIGTQNYTCTAAGNYTSAGAVATLIDISCLYQYNPKLFEDVQDRVYNLMPMYGHNIPSWHKIEAVLGHYPYIVGDHYFIPEDGAIAPKFGFRRSGKGDVDAFTVDKRVGGIPSPENSRNIDWLQLQSTAGELSKYTFRVDTQGGQPPKSCHKEGHTITVPYTTKYWFLK